MEEDVSERYLGRILSSRDDNFSSDGSSRGKKEGRSSRRRVATRRVVADKAAKVSDEDKPKSTHKASKTVAKPTTANKVANNKEATNNNPGARKRNTRTTRRQRGDDSELFVGDVGDIEKVKKRPRVAAPKVGPDESVVEVKMLTGTVSNP